VFRPEFDCIMRALEEQVFDKTAGLGSDPFRSVVKTE
jgi:hypothetical protein